MSGICHLRLVVLTVLAFHAVTEMEAAETFDPSPASRRPVSWVTEVIAARLPKYVEHSSVETEDVAESAEATENKEGTLQMPTMKIRPVMKAAPSDYSFLTEKGRMDLALKTYRGLRFGNLLGSNNAVMMAMQLEEQEARKVVALKDQVQRISGDNSIETRENLRLLKAATQRLNNEWLYGQAAP